VESECEGHNIQFYVLLGDPSKALVKFVMEYKIAIVVLDFSPLKEDLDMLNSVKSSLPAHALLFQVDAHNVVPAWIVSDSLTLKASSFADKLKTHLPEYVEPYPSVLIHPYELEMKLKGEDDWLEAPVDWTALMDRLDVDLSVDAVEWAHPGEQSALQQLQDFIEDIHSSRTATSSRTSSTSSSTTSTNCCETTELCQATPGESGHSSSLSPFSSSSSSSTSSMPSTISTLLATGQLAPLRFLLEIQEATRDYPAAFLAAFDQFVCWREMADNLCLYNPSYDKIFAAPKWAKDTLTLHQDDPRPETYSFIEMEMSSTSDAVFNAAQQQLVLEGRIIPEVVSYWRKKFLFWTSTPKEALRYCLLNCEKYLVGRLEPTVFVDALKDIFGLHDKEAKEEKDIVGKIPTISAKSLDSFINVDEYVREFMGSE